MRKRALIVIGTLLFCLSQIGVNYLIYKHQNNVEIPKVQLRDIKENKKDKKNSFAIMLEQDDGSYTQTSSNSFNQPGYTFNSEKSGCIDVNGNKIADSLSYNESTKAVVVSVSSTAYCYAYFDVEKIAGAIKPSELWHSDELTGDGYRYTGTNPDNYICFGTTTKATCTGNTDAYMYRIIGVFESGGKKYMKLIKKEALNSTSTWNSSNSDVDWESSTIYSTVNGDTYLNNTTYIPNSTWKNRIADWTWNTVNTKTYESSGTSYYYSSPKSIYQNEMIMANNSSITCAKGNDTDGTSARCAVGELKTKVAKIGLMYASDYALSLGEEAKALTTGTNTNRAKLKTGWMHLSNNDSGAPSAYEWTISRFGSNGSGYYHAWYVNSDGRVDWFNVRSTSSVRPVFYLESTQVIKSGSGTLSDPFLLS